MEKGQWKDPGSQTVFALERNPTLLSGSPFALFFYQEIAVVPRRDSPGRWKVSTQKYTYAIECSVERKELLGFHWRREQSGPVPYPHLQGSFAGGDGAPLSRKNHIPSGRVALEDIAFFAIQELRVHPRRSDWRDVLDRNRRAFLEFKTAE